MVDKIKKWASGWVLGAGLLFLAIGPVQAASISWNLTNEFSGGTQPNGVPNVTITDVTGGVSLKMTAPNSGTEYVDLWYFNVAIDPSTLTFTGPTTSGTFTAPSLTTCVSQGDTFNCTDATLKADGDGYYDFLFSFANANANRFNSGDMATYVITGSGLDVSDFLTLSLPGGGNGPFYTAAHVLSIAPSGGSGWVSPSAVPAPTSLLLFGTGLIGLVGIARREMLVNFFGGSKRV